MQTTMYRYDDFFISYNAFFNVFFSYPQLIRTFSIEFHNEIPELAERTKRKRAVRQGVK